MVFHGFSILLGNNHRKIITMEIKSSQPGCSSPFSAPRLQPHPPAAASQGGVDRGGAPASQWRAAMTSTCGRGSWEGQGWMMIPGTSWVDLIEGKS